MTFLKTIFLELLTRFYQNLCNYKLARCQATVIYDLCRGISFRSLNRTLSNSSPFFFFLSCLMDGKTISTAYILACDVLLHGNFPIFLICLVLKRKKVKRFVQCLKIIHKLIPFCNSIFFNCLTELDDLILRYVDTTLNAQTG